MKKVTILLIVISICIGCGKNNENSANSFKSDEFPLTVGSWWKYNSTDFISKNIDTLTLKIKSIQVDGTISKINCEIYNNKNVLVDTGIFIKEGSKVQYKGKNAVYSYFGNFVLKFPFAPEENWIGIYNEDTVRAVGYVENLTINTVKYDKLYTLKRSFYLIGGYSWVQDIIVSTNIGIVQQNYKEFDFGLIRQKDFSLIEYYIAK
jgi:hypothetical protein